MDQIANRDIIGYILTFVPQSWPIVAFVCKLWHAATVRLKARHAAQFAQWPEHIARRFQEDEQQHLFYVRWVDFYVNAAAMRGIFKFDHYNICDNLACHGYFCLAVKLTIEGKYWPIRSEIVRIYGRVAHHLVPNGFYDDHVFKTCLRHQRNECEHQRSLGEHQRNECEHTCRIADRYYMYQNYHMKNCVHCVVRGEGVANVSSATDVSIRATDALRRQYLIKYCYWAIKHQSYVDIEYLDHAVMATGDKELFAYFVRKCPDNEFDVAIVIKLACERHDYQYVRRCMREATKRAVKSQSGAELPTEEDRKQILAAVIATGNLELCQWVVRKLEITQEHLDDNPCDLVNDEIAAWLITKFKMTFVAPGNTKLLHKYINYIVTIDKDVIYSVSDLLFLARQSWIDNKWIIKTMLHHLDIDDYEELAPLYDPPIKPSTLVGLAVSSGNFQLAEWLTDCYYKNTSFGYDITSYQFEKYWPDSAEYMADFKITKVGGAQYRSMDYIKYIIGNNDLIGKDEINGVSLLLSYYEETTEIPGKYLTLLFDIVEKNHENLMSWAMTSAPRNLHWFFAAYLPYRVRACANNAVSTLFGTTSGAESTLLPLATSGGLLGWPSILGPRSETIVPMSGSACLAAVVANEENWPIVSQNELLSCLFAIVNEEFSQQFVRSHLFAGDCNTIDNIHKNRGFTRKALRDNFGHKHWLYCFRDLLEPLLP